MALTKPIETVRQDLQAQLVEDIAGALKELQGMLPENSEKYALVLALLGRLNDANKARLRNTMSNEDLQIEYNKIRADLLDMIQALQEADFDAAKAAEAGATGKPAPKQGSVLYRIPKVMPKQKETKCVVRIAMSEEAIVENITIDDQVVLKELYKVTDTMQVEMLDPSGGQVFRISSISEAIQIIDEEGYTEWWFYVTPLEEGTHPLVLKIAIIEMVNGQPRQKELVLEESVQIVTEGPAPDEPGESDLKPAGYALSFETSAPVQVAYNVASAPAAAAAPLATAAPAKSKTTPLRTATMALAIVVLGSAATWAFTPAQLRAWWATQLMSSNNPSAYRDYAARYPGSPYREKAEFREAELLNTPETYRNYLRAYPQGQYQREALGYLNKLELAALGQLRKDPDATALREFLIQFPESPYLDSVRKLVEQNDALRPTFLPIIQQQLEECRRLAPLINFVEQFPPVGTGGDDANPVNRPSGSPSAGTNTAVTPESARPNPAQPTGSAPNTLPDNAQPQPANPQAQTPFNAVAPRPVKAIQPDMVWVDGGTFQMGSDAGVKDEAPVHPVTISGFWVGKYEVTFAEYDRFCEALGRARANDEGWGRDNQPVIGVTWFDAAAYCNWLSAQDGLAPVYTFTADTVVSLRPKANGYRLLTEAEWEYAARGGNTGGNFLYSGSNELDPVAWYAENARSRTHPVGQKKPNQLGLYDMTGNVREWCFDYYGPYSATPSTDPSGRAVGKSRVIRGGQFGRNPEQQRSTYRTYAPPKFKDYGTGFRLARAK